MFQVVFILRALVGIFHIYIYELLSSVKLHCGFCLSLLPGTNRPHHFRFTGTEAWLDNDCRRIHEMNLKYLCVKMQANCWLPASYLCPGMNSMGIYTPLGNWTQFPTTSKKLSLTSVPMKALPISSNYLSSRSSTNPPLLLLGSGHWNMHVATKHSEHFQICRNKWHNRDAKTLAADSQGWRGRLGPRVKMPSCCTPRRGRRKCIVETALDRRSPPPDPR